MTLCRRLCHPRNKSDSPRRYIYLSNHLDRFVFNGIGFLMDDLLIDNARYISLANALGMKKISRNVLALQQCVKTIVSNAHDGELLRAKQYYSLFSLNPQVC